MARLTIVPVQPIGSYPAVLPIGVNTADFVWAAPGVAADGIGFVNDGRKVLLVHNINAGAQTVTISSVPYLGRSGDITTYSVGIDEYAMFGPFNGQGWNQPSGQVHAVGSHAEVLFAVLDLPSNIFPNG